MDKILTILKPFMNYTLVNLFAKVLVSLIILFFPKILNAEQYGTFILGYSFFQLIVVFVTAGHYETLISDKRLQNRKKMMVGSLVYSFFILIFLLLVLSYPLRDTFKSIDLLSIILGGIALGHCLLLVKYFFLISRNKLAIKVYLIFSVILYISCFLFTYKTNEWRTFFEVASVIGVVFLLYVFMAYFRGVKIKVKDVFVFQKKALPYVVIAFIGWLGGYGYNYFVDNQFPLEIVGAFGFVLSITNFVLVISNSINLVWSSKLFKIFANGENKMESDVKVWSILSMLIMLMTIFLSIIFPKFVEVFYDNNQNFKELGKFIPLIGLAYIVYVPTWQAKNYYYYHNDSWKLLFKTAVSGVLGIVSAFLLIKYFSILGLFIGFFVNYLVQSIVITYYSVKKWRYKTPYKSVIISFCTLLLLFLFNFT